MPTDRDDKSLPSDFSHYFDDFVPIITDIVNSSLETGLMPDGLKHAMIKPLMKKAGLSLNLKNYQPVCNLKLIIEGAVMQQYNEHLVKNNLQDPKQSAYKQFHRTETLLTKLNNDILTDGNKGESTMLVLLDLSNLSI